MCCDRCSLQFQQKLCNVFLFRSFVSKHFHRTFIALSWYKHWGVGGYFLSYFLSSPRYMLYRRKHRHLLGGAHTPLVGKRERLIGQQEALVRGLEITPPALLQRCCLSIANGVTPTAHTHTHTCHRDKRGQRIQIPWGGRSGQIDRYIDIRGFPLERGDISRLRGRLISGSRVEWSNPGKGGTVWPYPRGGSINMYPRGWRYN